MPRSEGRLTRFLRGFPNLPNGRFFRGQETDESEMGVIQRQSHQNEQAEPAQMEQSAEEPQIASA